MAKKYLDYDGVLYFWQKIKAAFALKAEVPAKSSTTPIADGTAATGSETAYAAGDHVHPTDTTRAPLASPAFTGTPTAPTAATGTATTQIATTEFVSNTVGAMTSGVADVQINNTSIVESGIAKIPQYPIYNGAAGMLNLFQKVYSGDAYSTWVIKYQNANSSNVNNAEFAKTNLASATGRGLMSSADKTKLDSLTVTNGVIDASNLPSYVDDVIEAYPRSGQTALSSTWLATGSASGTVITPETGKIYVLMADSGDYAANTQFRWGGTAYVKMADGGVSSITNAEIDTIVAS